MTNRRVLTKTMAVGLALGMNFGCVTAGRDGSNADRPPAEAYAREGFFTQLDADGRVWVFRVGSPELTAFQTEGKPAKHAVRPGAGPSGVTLKSVDSETIIEYVATKPGFVVAYDTRDERLWVFSEGSEDLAKFEAEGRPARHVLRPGAGPLGLTLKSTESSTIIEYVVTREGFFTQLDGDGRLWVFRADSPELASYLAAGKPAKHVVRPGAGPLGLTLKAVDVETLDAYQAAK